MKAKVVTPFPGCEDGKVYPRQIEKDEVIEGDLARTAIAMGWAKKHQPRKSAAKKEAPAKETEDGKGAAGDADPTTGQTGEETGSQSLDLDPQSGDDSSTPSEESAESSS